MRFGRIGACSTDISVLLDLPHTSISVLLDLPHTSISARSQDQTRHRPYLIIAT